MKGKTLAAIVFSLVMCFGLVLSFVPAFALSGIVQSASNSCGATSCTCVLLGTVTANDLIVVDSFSGNPTVSVTDGLTGSYSNVNSKSDANVYKLNMATKLTGGGSGDTITVSTSGGGAGFVRVTCYEVSHISSATPVSTQNANGAAVQSTSAAVGSWTPTAGNFVMASVSFDPAAGSCGFYSAGSPYSLGLQVGDTVLGQCIGDEWNSPASATATTSPMTNGLMGYWAEIVSGFGSTPDTTTTTTTTTTTMTTTATVTTTSTTTSTSTAYTGQATVTLNHTTTATSTLSTATSTLYTGQATVTSTSTAFNGTSTKTSTSVLPSNSSDEGALDVIALGALFFVCALVYSYRRRNP